MCDLPPEKGTVSLGVKESPWTFFILHPFRKGQIAQRFVFMSLDSIDLACFTKILVR